MHCHSKFNVIQSTKQQLHIHINFQVYIDWAVVPNTTPITFQNSYFCRLDAFSDTILTYHIKSVKAMKTKQNYDM